jgi:hypothetical protein
MARCAEGPKNRFTPSPEEAVFMNGPLVLTATIDAIAVLTLNQPTLRNPLSRAMLTELRGHLEQIATRAERFFLSPP